MIRAFFIALLLWLLPFAATPAHAEIVKHYFRISSGTGFFVSNMGYIITNEHVVRGCDKVVLRSNQIGQFDAEVRATDPEHDLALIYTPRQPLQTAPLRENIEDLKPGDKVLVMGYPGDAGITGGYQIADSQVVNVNGPQGHPEWIQFGESAQKGNSGGPLLDQSGNVIGVVVAKGQTFMVNKLNGQQQLVEKSDLAISLATVKNFLQEHGVYARGVTSAIQLDDSRIEYMARDFIMNVQCRKPMSAEDAANMGSEANGESTETSGMHVIEMPPEQLPEQQ